MITQNVHRKCFSQIDSCGLKLHELFSKPPNERQT